MRRSACPAAAENPPSLREQEAPRRPGSSPRAQDAPPVADWSASPVLPLAPSPQLWRRSPFRSDRNVPQSLPARSGTDRDFQNPFADKRRQDLRAARDRKRMNGSRTSFHPVWLTSRRLRTQTPTPYEPSVSATTFEPRAAISSSSTIFSAGTNAHSSCNCSGVRLLESLDISVQRRCAEFVARSRKIIPQPDASTRGVTAPSGVRT